MNKVYTDIADRILVQLEAGNLPWDQPWSSIGGNGMPRNAQTGRAYSGVNVLLLWAEAVSKGYPTHGWLTYKQAEALGGNVRKGEKGTHICYVSSFEKKDDAGEIERVPFLKAYVVFNVAQCDDLALPEAPDAAINPDQRDADCAAFLASTGADIRHGAGQACYIRKQDCIMMPTFEAFKSAAGYYATALHELVHWTGAPHRLDRTKGKVFGDKAYAAEELVAELGAAFLCAEFGFDTVTQSASYIQSWIKMLRDNPRAFITAASAASKATEYLRGLALAEDPTPVAEAA
jgi:antirestriction protein ArdC